MSEIQLPSPDNEPTYLDGNLTPRDVFISYSRIDKEFVRRLFEALKAVSRKAWVDWNIPPGTVFRERIYTGIEAASNFVFVLSPDSIKSNFCLDEFEYALKNNKRIIPLLYRSIDPPNIKEELERWTHLKEELPQWIPFTEQEPFDSAFQGLLETLSTDQAYLDKLTILLIYAKEWERQGKDSSRALRGKELKEAERLLQEGATKTPPPTKLVMDFLQVSSRQQITRRTMLGVLGGVALGTFGFLVERSQHVITKTNVITKTKPPQVIYPPRPLPYSYTGHTNAVKSVAWSPDSKRIASADDYVQVLDASSGTFLFTCDGGGCVAWSPDGSRIASPGVDKTVQVWDASNGKLLLTYRGHADVVNSVAWSPNGKRIASASDDKTVQVWDARSGKLLLTYRGHADVVNSVAWSPDGRHIASGSGTESGIPPGSSQDKTVQVWDASSGTLLFTYTGHADAVLCVAWSPDGSRIASASADDTVQVWTASSGTLLLTYTGHTDVVDSVVWSPSGEQVASASNDHSMQVWDASSGTRVLTYTGHTSGVNSVAWSPDGKRLASASDDKTVQVWDASSSGTRLLTYRGHTDKVESVAWSPDGKHLASASVDGTVQVWDASSGTRLLTYTGHTGGVYSVAWSPDGKRIASASSDDGTVQVWDASSGTHLLTYTGQNLINYSSNTFAVRCAAWSPDGNRIVSTGEDGTVQVWDASSGTPLFTYTGHMMIQGHVLPSVTVFTVAWSPDGHRIASASDKTVQVWFML